MSRDWSQLRWKEKTFGEKVQTVLCNVVGTILTLAGVIGVLAVLGQIIDTQNARRIEHRQCLKHATNGLEIMECGQ